jgi:hypothetical protein
MMALHGLAGRSLFFDPLQVKQVAGHLVVVLVAATEFSNELGLWITTFVNNDAAQLALFLAHIVNLRAHHVAQFFNGFGSEPDRHQLIGQAGAGS